ncbi:RDD family protein [Halobacillus litoralis]|uniref:RDD family protein n=1 Tax=Halobacillus litoralis TaxID=45668 RepID=UPI001CD2E446|nr:RDD family protein [Halobacillus litoralis]MCA0969329.1 RDD family protein [Halobacillus litoralis]
MKPMTKKRTKAIMIDLAISSVVTLAVEPLLRKRVKQEWVHALITPTVAAWGLEYAQMKCKQKTVGYKAMGLVLEDENGGRLTDGQIVKRMAYRDSIGFIDYMKNRDTYEGEDGAVLSHDRYARTVVREEDRIE